MTFVGGYFYFIDDDWDALMQKLSDGGTAFSYPLDTVLTSAVTSLEYDGVNFWTLQDPGAGTITIRRWQIENSVCWLKNTLNLSTFDSDTFTVEHYHTSLAATASGGDTSIKTNRYYDTVIVSGTVLTLGPNSSDQYEDVTVSGVVGTDIILVSGTQNTYNSGNAVNFYNNLWIFNNTGDGTLHKVNARTGANITTYSGSEYDNITACTFARVKIDSTVDTLVYVKATNIKYLNINTLGTYGVMTIDNFKPPATTIVVYDVAIAGRNIYRLQNEARYYGANYSWGSEYNYVLSTTRRFIDTISVSADPVILPANGVNVVEVTAIVNDQYGDGVSYKPIFFTDNDDVGFITINPAFTDYFFGTGAAVTYYKAGVNVQTVTIEGTATQYD